MYHMVHKCVFTLTADQSLGEMQALPALVCATWRTRCGWGRVNVWTPQYGGAWIGGGLRQAFVPLLGLG